MFKSLLVTTLLFFSFSLFAQEKKPNVRPEVLASKCTPEIDKRLRSFMGKIIVESKRSELSSGLTGDGLFKGEIVPYSLSLVDCDQVTLNSYNDNGEIYYSLKFIYVDSDFVLYIDGKEVKERFIGTVNLKMGTFDRWAKR